MKIEVNIEEVLLGGIMEAAEHQDLTLDQIISEMAMWYLKDFVEVVKSADRHEAWADKWVKELQEEASQLED